VPLNGIGRPYAHKALGYSPVLSLPKHSVESHSILHGYPDAILLQNFAHSLILSQIAKMSDPRSQLAWPFSISVCPRPEFPHLSQKDDLHTSLGLIDPASARFSSQTLLQILSQASMIKRAIV